MIAQAQPKINLRIAQPPQRPAVATGAEHDRLFKTAQSVIAKGQPVRTRYTAPLKGERFLMQLHQARNRNTGEVFHAATYRSATVPGHARTLLVTPEGDAWLFFDADGKTPAKAVLSGNKYRGHLWTIAQEGR